MFPAFSNWCDYAVLGKCMLGWLACKVCCWCGWGLIRGRMVGTWWGRVRCFWVFGKSGWLRLIGGVLGFLLGFLSFWLGGLCWGLFCRPRVLFRWVRMCCFMGMCCCFLCLGRFILGVFFISPSLLYWRDFRRKTIWDSYADVGL